jgi:hypothetical protein
MLRAYFGEPEGEKCGICDSDAGLDSEVFDSGSADERHGLHAATDFHARPRRRRRGRGPQDLPVPTMPSVPAAPAAPVFEWAIPTDLLPPLAPFEIPVVAESENVIDETFWAAGNLASLAGEPLHGEVVIQPDDDWTLDGAGEAESAAPIVEDARPPVDRTAEISVAAPTTIGDESGATTASAAPLPPPLSDTGWGSVRDANIRPYHEWRPPQPVTLPVLTVRPGSNLGPGSQNHSFHNGGGSNRGNNGGGQHHGNAYNNGRPGYSAKGQQMPGGKGQRRRRRGRDRDRPGGNKPDQFRNRDRGPRLPGFYNPGGD